MSPGLEDGGGGGHDDETTWLRTIPTDTGKEKGDLRLSPSWLK